MATLLIIVAVILIGLAIRSGVVAARKRREALTSLAAALGWSFDPASDTGHDEEFGHFEIFQNGHSRAAYNTLRGEMEVNGERWPAKAGDFLYKITTSNGKTTTTHTHRFSYLIVHLPYSNVPDLLIRREHLFDKLAGVFGFDDIDFESEEFSRRYHVKSSDKRFAYGIVHPEMMEFLLGAEPPRLDVEQGQCCLSGGSGCWKPERFSANVNTARRFLELWPTHVVSGLEAR
jgi:hypothetical protein